MGIERVAHWCILALDRRASSTLRGRLSKHAVRTLCHGTRCHDQRHVHAICIGLSGSSEAFLFAARVASRVLARTARGRPWSRLRHAEGQPRGVSMTMTWVSQRFLDPRALFVREHNRKFALPCLHGHTAHAVRLRTCNSQRTLRTAKEPVYA